MGYTVDAGWPASVEAAFQCPEPHMDSVTGRVVPTPAVEAQVVTGPLADLREAIGNKTAFVSDVQHGQRDGVPSYPM